MFRYTYKTSVSLEKPTLLHALHQCFSTTGPRPGTGPGINYTGPREVLLEFVVLVFKEIFMNKCFIVEIF